MTDWIVGGREGGRFSRDPLPVLHARGPCEQFWQGQGCPLFDVIHPVIPPPTTASPTLRGALKDGNREAVVDFTCPKPCKFPYLDSRQKRFLWTHKEVDLAPHPVVSLMHLHKTPKSFYLFPIRSIVFKTTLTACTSASFFPTDFTSLCIECIQTKVCRIQLQSGLSTPCA